MKVRERMPSPTRSARLRPENALAVAAAAQARRSISSHASRRRAAQSTRTHAPESVAHLHRSRHKYAVRIQFVRPKWAAWLKAMALIQPASGLKKGHRAGLKPKMGVATQSGHADQVKDQRRANTLSTSFFQNTHGLHFSVLRVELLQCAASQ